MTWHMYFCYMDSYGSGQLLQIQYCGNMSAAIIFKHLNIESRNQTFIIAMIKTKMCV